MKKRLDALLVERGLAADQEQAARMILAGEILVNDFPADKAGNMFCKDSTIRVREKCPFVSRGGLKLQEGLRQFDISPQGWCCLDVGASSGGFTDCLLQAGATKVFAVDVAYGQLDWKIRQDSRVVVIERTNAKKLTPEFLGQPIDLVVMDISFISITKIIPVLLPLFASKIQILTLIKPQFELPKEKIAKGGVVTDTNLHQEAIKKITTFASQLSLTCQPAVESPIKGAKGNTEFLMLLTGI
ncbi:MAG: TlyA family rRNA (cytidine-2'-O)-methyltransferase [Deltaproteobacteria bacterium]|nr:MAG: TlyA family rRNA (cytidine-2'-O)-methyltransferase [Deltaproteobacteria bacterium]